MESSIVAVTKRVMPLFTLAVVAPSAAEMWLEWQLQ